MHKDGLSIVQRQNVRCESLKVIWIGIISNHQSKWHNSYIYRCRQTYFI